MAKTTNRYLAYPAAAAGISIASSGGAAWTFSAYTEIVPVSTITSVFYIAGLAWMWHTPLAGTDTTYEWLIELASNTAVAPVLIARVVGNIREDSNAGYTNSPEFIFSEPYFLPANTQIGCRVAYSLATTSNTLSGIKIWYQTV